MMCSPCSCPSLVRSEFQLIAGTNRDLYEEVMAGRFREDLYVRINLWTYVLPGMRERPEDIEPNLDYLLTQFSEENAQMVRLNREARNCFMQFAISVEAQWTGNFLDLLASVTRMATLADSGNITEAIVRGEIGRLQGLWQRLGCRHAWRSASAPDSARWPCCLASGFSCRTVRAK